MEKEMFNKNQDKCPFYFVFVLITISYLINMKYMRLYVLENLTIVK